MRADGCKLERSVTRAERTMPLRAVRRLRLGCAALVVTPGHGTDDEPVFAEVGDKLRDDMSWEKARIGKHSRTAPALRSLAAKIVEPPIP